MVVAVVATVETVAVMAEATAMVVATAMAAVAKDKTHFEVLADLESASLEKGI